MGAGATEDVKGMRPGEPGSKAGVGAVLTPAAAEPAPPVPRAGRYAWIGTAASVLLFAASLVVLWHIAREVDPAEVRRALTAASREQIGLALLFTAVSYLLLTCYDALALRQLALKVRYRTTALASFTSYAVSFTLGFPMLTGGTVRYWIYKPAGLGAAKVASLTVIAGLTFWVGMGAILAVSLIRNAGDLAVLTSTSTKVSQLVGVIAAGLVIAYLIFVSIRRRSVKVKGWRLELPGLRLSLAQMVVGAGDICAAAAVLYVLIPPGHGIAYETFLAVYVLGVMLGIASHAPGGLGVFEATILLALSTLPRGDVLGALLLFRLFYYVIPFVLALALLGAYEVVQRLKAAQRELTAGDDG
jgi:glycosyltransferase 2 family protein